MNYCSITLFKLTYILNIGYFQMQYQLIQDFLKKEYAYAFREKSENSKLWTDSKVVFCVFGAEIQEILDKEEHIRG